MANLTLRLRRGRGEIGVVWYVLFVLSVCMVSTVANYIRHGKLRNLQPVNDQNYDTYSPAKPHYSTRARPAPQDAAYMSTAKIKE